MNKFTRMMDVLDLYSDKDTLLTAEDVASRLEVSRPTAFRYVKELSNAGFLASYAGRYSLGARIITLDYRIRESDPVLKVASGIMSRLSAETACGSILCRMYNDEVINVHQQAGYDAAGVTYSRGRPLPLFRGAASKVMLAHLPPNRIRKVCERHKNSPDLLKLGANWPEWRAYFAEVRRNGHYLSNQEVDVQTVGLAAPILVDAVGAVAVVSLVFSTDRLALINVDGYAQTVKSHAAEIGARLANIGVAGIP